MVEETLKETEQINYHAALWKLSPLSEKDRLTYSERLWQDLVWRWLSHAPWQQQVIALAKVKGIEI